MTFVYQTPPKRTGPGAGPIAVIALAVLAALALAAWAITSGGGGDEGGIEMPDPETTTTLGPPIAYTPAYETVGCPTDAEIPDLILGITCGSLKVPENRYLPGSREVVLSVITLPARSPNKKPDPIVYLDGGPGGDALSSLPLWYNESGLLNERDIIVVAQRGTYFAGPKLDCRESRALTFPQLSQDPDNADAVADRLEATGKCRHRLQNDAQLWTYNTREIAHDIADLRVAMGIPEWNLLGISYGTRVALEVARDFPDGIRSIILDSNYPPGINSYSEFAANGRRAIDAFFAACERSSCNTTYPNLRARYETLLNDLETTPRQFTVNDSLQSNEPVTVRWDADRLVQLTFSSLYSADRAAELPLLIQQLEASDMAAISQAVVDYTGLDAKFFSDGMNRSVQCRERYPFDDRAAIEAAKASQPPSDVMRALANGMLENWEDCGIWDVPAAEAAEDSPVATDKPTLVLAGELDPITPPAWGEGTAAALPHATFVLFPGEGHGLTPTPCGEEIVQAFLDNPGGPPPTGCVASLSTPDWL